MGKTFIAWVTVDLGEPSPRSILVRADGSTDPAKYFLPAGARIKVQMLFAKQHFAVEIVDCRIVVRERSLAPMPVASKPRATV